jgi:predicted transcriptional regulator
MAAISRPGDAFSSVGDAAKRLNLSPNSVKRRLTAGILKGYEDSENGYHYITNESIERLLRNRRQLQLAAQELPGRSAISDRWAADTVEDDD